MGRSHATTANITQRVWKLYSSHHVYSQAKHLAAYPCSQASLIVAIIIERALGKKNWRQKSEKAIITTR